MIGEAFIYTMQTQVLVEILKMNRMLFALTARVKDQKSELDELR